MFFFSILQPYENYGAYPEGSMNIPTKPDLKNIGKPDFNTLDEPIKVTIVCSVGEHQIINIIIYFLLDFQSSTIVNFVSDA